MKIYCSCCDKVQPIRIDKCLDVKTNEPFQDIVCAECDLVIASGTGIALAQPEQEPVAYIHRNEYNEYRLEPHDNFDIRTIPFNVDVPLFKSPQRKPLTDEEIGAILEGVNAYGTRLYTFARAIEAAHGIKGDA